MTHPRHTHRDRDEAGSRSSSGPEPELRGRRSTRRATRRRVIGGTVAGLVLAAGVGAGLVYALSGKSAQSAAEQIVDTMNTNGFGGVTGSICAEQRNASTDALQQLDFSRADVPPELRRVTQRFALVGPVTEHGDTASGTLAARFENVPPPAKAMLKDMNLRFEMVQEGGDWKLCNLKQQM